MKPGIFDITVYQGADFYCEIQWISGTEPTDLTGYTAKLQFRETVNSPLTLLNLTTENGGLSILTDPEKKGVIAISIDNTETSSFRFKTAVYDLKLTNPDGEVTRLLEGTVVLSKEVTR